MPQAGGSSGVQAITVGAVAVTSGSEEPGCAHRTGGHVGSRAIGGLRRAVGAGAMDIGRGEDSVQSSTLAQRLGQIEYCQFRSSRRSSSRSNASQSATFVYRDMIRLHALDHVLRVGFRGVMRVALDSNV